jgi:5'(3')-deoxyribonucleotidase
MKVIFDMDGVLADFIGGLFRVLDFRFEIYPYSLPKGLWNFFEFMKKEYGIDTDKEIPRICSDSAFWENLSVLPGAKFFHDKINLLHDISFLSAPTGDILLNGEGKAKWLRKHDFMGQNENKLIITTPEGKKGAFANPDTILLDDKDENVQDFLRGGGKAVLVPRPWNNRHWEFRTYEQANLIALYNLEQIVTGTY